jgi:negative regulator of replication initiation
MAREIDRIAEWCGVSASEIARELLKFGIAAERQLEAEKLMRPYGSIKVDRAAENVEVNVTASYRFYTVAELARREQALDEAIETGEIVETTYTTKPPRL